MEEIAEFVGRDGAGEIYLGLAALYAQLASDAAGPGTKAKALHDFVS